MADDFLYGAARQGLKDSERDLGIAYAKIRELRSKRKAELEMISDLKQEVLDSDFSIDIRTAHQEASDAKIEYLMNLLDEKCGGADKNPARQAAYTDEDAMRIPSGDREGEIVTRADHVYLAKFADVFKSRFKSRWTHVASWKNFLHNRISY